MKLKIFTLLFLFCFTTHAFSTECVILLHGLARSASSMESLAEELDKAGYYTVNIDYPSRKMQIHQLADLAINEGLEKCEIAKTERVNFVTHSLGGILVRHYYTTHSLKNLHRVVMLGPPNQGSQVVDQLKDLPGFQLINGPAGLQLGTDENSVPNNLAPVNFELGVIAGTMTINPILSTYLPNPDDGKVSVENTKVSGMCAFMTVATSHPFLMKNSEAINETLHFLNTGSFTQTSGIIQNCATQLKNHQQH